MGKAFWNADVEDLLRAGPDFDLRRVDPDATPGTGADKSEGEDELARGAQELRVGGFEDRQIHHRLVEVETFRVPPGGHSGGREQR